jgi:hypothetical protein
MEQISSSKTEGYRLKALGRRPKAQSLFLQPTAYGLQPTAFALPPPAFNLLPAVFSHTGPAGLNAEATAVVPTVYSRAFSLRMKALDIRL